MSAERLTVTWRITFENIGGPLPDPSDGDASDELVQVLMEHAPFGIDIDLGYDDSPHLDAVAWSLDAGPYADMHIGDHGEAG